MDTTVIELLILKQENLFMSRKYFAQRASKPRKSVDAAEEILLQIIKNEHCLKNLSRQCVMPH